MTFAAASLVNTGHGQTFRVVTWAAASLATVIGIFMVVAWHSHSDWLWVTVPGMFYMKYNTSVAFIAGGAGLLVAQRGKKQYTFAAGATLLGLGGLTFIQFLAGANFPMEIQFSHLVGKPCAHEDIVNRACFRVTVAEWSGYDFYRRLPALKRRVAELEQRIAELEEKLATCRIASDQ